MESALDRPTRYFDRSSAKVFGSPAELPRLVPRSPYGKNSIKSKPESEEGAEEISAGAAGANGWG
jgi:hypothetical protein